MYENAPLNWPLGELLQGWAAMQVNESNLFITGLSLDSRTTCAGDLFFALQGMQQHGLDYCEQAISNGAAAIAWESSQMIDRNNLPTAVACVEIKNLQKQLGFICARFYQHKTEAQHIVGVTGTDGKTSVSQFIAQAWENLGLACGVIGTLGYGIYPNFSNASHTTPDAVLTHKLLYDFYSEDISHVVLEASSHGLKQGRINGVSITTAVFTNLGRDHMDYHDSLEDYANSKRLLFETPNLKNAVINIDDAFGAQLATQFSDSLNVISYSVQENFNQLNSSQAYIYAHNIVYRTGVMHFEIDSSWGKAKLQTNLIGLFNISNLLAALGALLVDGVEFDQAIEAVAGINTIPGRMEFVYFANSTGSNFPTVVVDYAHTPQALEKVLNVLRKHCIGKLWCVFGCGGNRDQGKRSLMAQAVERCADFAVVTDDNPRFENPAIITDEICSGFTKDARYTLIHDRKEAIKYAVEHANNDDIILIAGKGHEAVQIINDKQFPFNDKKVAKEILQQRL